MILSEEDQFWGLVANLHWSQLRGIAKGFSKSELEKLKAKFDAAKVSWACNSCNKIEALSTMFSCTSKKL